MQIDVAPYPARTRIWTTRIVFLLSLVVLVDTAAASRARRAIPDYECSGLQKALHVLSVSRDAAERQRAVGFLAHIAEDAMRGIATAARSPETALSEYATRELSRLGSIHPIEKR